MEHTIPSIIDEMEQYKPIAYATTGQRFANYLIDLIVYYLIFFILTFILGVLSGVFGVDMVSLFFSQESVDRVLVLLIGCVIMFWMYILSEGITKGRTIGKLITGTKAVKEDNSPITWKDALRRSLIRFIPFEPFSAFSGNGMWHDRLSKTMVVKTRGV